MASGISRSTEKVVFAKYRRNRMECEKGSWEKREMQSQTNTLIRDPNRKDRGIRKYFKEHGYKAPNLEDDGQTYSEEQRNTGNRIINVQQARTKNKGDER